MSARASKPAKAAPVPAPPCGRTLARKPASARDTEALLRSMTAKLDAYVIEKKLNRTSARNRMLEAIVEDAHHFRAQDLVDKLQARFPDEVGRSTVYRNLPILVESGLLQEGPSGADGQVLYELSDDDHHDHIVCLDCNQIFEFHDEAIEKIQSRVSKELGFSVKDHRHVVYASCDRLARAAGKSAKPAR